MLKRETVKITEHVFNNTIATMGVTLTWSYRRVAHGLGLYVVSKLSGSAKTTAESASMSSGFEMYRLITKRFDNITADTECLMLSEITNFSGKQCKDIGELSIQLTSFCESGRIVWRQDWNIS